MATTRLALQNEIYEILQKSPTAYGLFTPAKVSAAINDSLNYIQSKMIRIGTGWLTKRAYLNIVAGTQSIALPTGVAVINFIKKQTNGTDYEPITFEENATGISSTQTPAGQTGVPFYHLVDGAIFLEPIPGVSLTDGLLIEYVAYPSALTADASLVDTQLDLPAFIQYAKWRSAKMLYSLGNQHGAVPAWAQYEAEWLMEVQTIIAKRIRMPGLRLAFSDY